MKHLQNSLRSIGDSYLHTQIRKNEVLPVKTQIDFRQDLEIKVTKVSMGAQTKD